jgi:hypothetical protein
VFRVGEDFVRPGLPIEFSAVMRGGLRNGRRWKKQSDQADGYERLHDAHLGIVRMRTATGWLGTGVLGDSLNVLRDLEGAGGKICGAGEQCGEIFLRGGGFLSQLACNFAAGGLYGLQFRGV